MQWLVTGCSSGLGLTLARAVLRHPGQRVIATSRNPASSPEAVNEITSDENGSWATLDVSSPDLESQLSAIVAQHGPIDVLINNAGYAVGGVLESLPLDRIHSQYETNFFGPVRLMKAVIPSMRERNHGVIVNISSAEFWDPHPGATTYASSKSALEGFSEALAGEVATFGIRILVAQPGGMRTDFVEPAKVAKSLEPLPTAYEGTMADFVLEAIVGGHGAQSLDPEKTAQTIVEEILNPTIVKDTDGQVVGQLLRLPLGKECVAAMHAKLQRSALEGRLVKERALACDFSG